MLAEHNTRDLKEMQSQLRSLGYRIAAMASSGEQALEKARVIRPDLVLMNMRIKGKMGSIKAAEFIRKRLNIPVIFLLDNEDEKTLNWIKETARCEYLLKPVEESRAFRTIEMILAKQWAEKQLKEKEQWLNAVLENIQDAVIITDKEGSIIRLNALAEDLTGWNQVDALEQDIHAVFPILHLGTGEPLGNPVSKVLITGHADTSVKQAMLRTRAGKEIPIESSVAPILLGKDNIGGAILVFCDATEHLRIKEELNKSTHDLGKRVRELNCLYAISKLIEKSGVRMEELLSETANLVLSAMEYPEMACARIRLDQSDFCTANFAESPHKITAHITVRGERVGSLEIYYLHERPDRDYGPFLKEEWDLINAVAERLGRIIGRKRTEEAFQLEKAQFEQLFESAQEAIVVSELNGRVRLINSEFTRLFGYTQEEAEGRQIDDLVAPDKRNEEAKVITRRVASMQNVALETVRRHKDGTPIEVSLLGSPIVINGKQVGVYGIYRNITEHLGNLLNGQIGIDVVVD
ncbi:PAS domain S-box protein, partial [Candidatus Zixiibacteriota bacterium]